MSESRQAMISDFTDSNRYSGGSEVVCPTCARSDFANRKGMRHHHAMVHDESLAKVKTTCEVCGDTYEIHEGDADGTRCCSRECYGIWQSEYNTGENNPNYRDAKTSVECKWCGKKFEAQNPERRKFCSRDCRGKWESENRTGQNHPSWEGGKLTEKCDECQEEYEVWPSQAENKRFCSSECMGEWFSKNRTGENSPTWDGGPDILECEWCQEEFEAQSSQVERRRFCSRECRSEWCSDNLTGKNSPIWVQKITKECDFCATEYNLAPSQADNSRFCSRECKDKWRSENLNGEQAPNWQGGSAILECDYCGKEYHVDPHRAEESRFCSYDCKGNWLSENRAGQDHWAWRGGNSIRVAITKQFHGKSWRSISERVREEENGCRVCGDAENLHVHHIIPVMSGGTNDDWNLMPLCDSCHPIVEWHTRSFTEPLLVE